MEVLWVHAWWLSVAEAAKTKKPWSSGNFSLVAFQFLLSSLSSPFDVATPDGEDTDDLALLSPRTKTCFLERAIYLMKWWNFRHPFPLPPGWCLSRGLAAISGCPPVAVNPVPWFMAADLDKEVGCSFSVTIRGLPSRSVLPVCCEEQLAVLV